MRSNAVANRERILAAAEEVFGRHGAAGSTEDVAARAGVGIATVFRHFPTKADLVEEVLIRHLDRVRADASAFADRPDAGEAFAELFATLVESGATKLALASQVGAPGSLPDRVRVASQALRDDVQALLVRAQADGGIRPGVRVDEVYLILRGLSHAALTTAIQPDTLRRAVELVLHGLRP